MTRVMMMVALMGMMMVGCEGGMDLNPFDSNDSASDMTQPVMILHEFNGVDAGFDTVGVEVIDSAEALEASGSVQLGQLEVDFASEMIVVMALGEQPSGGYWAKITALQVGESGGLYVQGIANQPGENEAVTLATTYPIHAVVVKKMEVLTVHPEIDSVVGQQFE